MADVINNFLGAKAARPIDSTAIKVNAPRDPAQKVMFLSVVENLQVDRGEGVAKIIVNSRTGTVVIGNNVQVSPAAVSHGSMIVTISENQQVNQPGPLAGGDTAITQNTNIEVVQKDTRMFKFDPGVELDDIVNAINRVGAAPGDLVAILEALKEAGALHGELIVI
jgi:flagellar P-ring protein FlgI